MSRCDLALRNHTTNHTSSDEAQLDAVAVLQLTLASLLRSASGFLDRPAADIPPDRANRQYPYRTFDTDEMRCNCELLSPTATQGYAGVRHRAGPFELVTGTLVAVLTVLFLNSLLAFDAQTLSAFGIWPVHGKLGLHGDM